MFQSLIRTGVFALFTNRLFQSIMCLKNRISTKLKIHNSRALNVMRAIPRLVRGRYVKYIPLKRQIIYNYDGNIVTL